MSPPELFCWRHPDGGNSTSPEPETQWTPKPLNPRSGARSRGSNPKSADSLNTYILNPTPLKPPGFGFRIRKDPGIVHHGPRSLDSVTAEADSPTSTMPNRFKQLQILFQILDLAAGLSQIHKIEKREVFFCEV